ncbi:MAG: hypothetical protein R3F59_19435 [Myxococcota bacterium]
MRRRLLGAVVVTAATVLACGSGPGWDVSSVRGKAVVSPPDLPAPAYEVAPDRALVSVAVRARADDRAAAGQRLRTALDRVTGGGSEAGCTVEIADYAPPSPASDGVRAMAALVADVPLAEVGTVRERMDRLDACLDAIAQVQLDDVDVTIGDPVPRVDHPEAHYAALADAFAAAGARAATVAGAHPEDRRCVPTGEVLVGQGRLSGVALSLDLSCHVATAAAGGA